MIKRIQEKTVIEYLQFFPVVAILGARQVGKTTLAKIIKNKYFPEAIYLDMESPADWFKLEEPELYLNQFQNKLIIIDEIQRKPELFPILRTIIDKNRKNGRFLILGSASPDLLKKSSESLAGRIAFIELTPFMLEEINSENYQKLWLRGGFPESFLAKDDKTSILWREFFVKTFLERDIPQFGLKIPAPNLRRFWLMLAHLQNQLWNASQIANNLGISAPTVKNYLDILHYTYMVRILQPFYTNVKKRLIKTPKIIIRDSGILHYLLNIKNYNDLISHPIVGHSWEGFVIEEILKLLPSEYEYFFYRTRAGAEIDFLITKAGKVIVAIEIKYSLTPKISKGFYNCVKDILPQQKVVVYPGEITYKKGDILILSIKNLPDYIKNLA